MFSIHHFIWLIICFAAIITASVLLKKYRPPIEKVLTAACVAAVLSELIKVFSELELVPSVSGDMMFPYIELENLPFHLCSLQIILIYVTRFMKPSDRRDALLAFMYPTCAIGAFFALMIPTVFAEIELHQAFTHPHAYEYFLYHAFLIILGIYIVSSGQVKIKGKHFISNMVLLAAMAFVSLYLNSVFAEPAYIDDELHAVEYTSNFLFTYRPPIDAIKLTEIWHWYIYLGVLILLASVLMAVMLSPYIIRDIKAKKNK